MLEFARWKYVVIAIMLVLTALYSLPNLYPKDPAVQISANRGAVIDAALDTRVENLLKANSMAFSRSEIEGDTLVVRVANTDLQAKASDVIRAELGTGYTVALNLATNVPKWLQAIGGKPMSLGLDLQGGVHFLMEVDEKSAIEKRSEGFLDNIRGVLRENQIVYSNAVRNGTRIQVQLKPEDISRARNKIGASTPELVLSTDQAQPNLLFATIPDALIKQFTDEAVEQNMTTLRNRSEEHTSELQSQ